MAKDRNSFAKRQREADKKRKAEQKRERRVLKKERSDAYAEADTTTDEEFEQRPR
jgi:hypothetical protein